MSVILRIIPVLTLLMFFNEACGQWSYDQYFDGVDTIPGESIEIKIDTTNGNIWQIGKPQKTIFNSAATIPNAIITDTVEMYPINNISVFEYDVQFSSNWGILAIQWKQKLDMDSVVDGGIVEFSTDSGVTWVNAFESPHVYNFYGYNSINVDTLPSGDIAFTGTDSTWKNIWICYDMSWLSITKGLKVRHTFMSDSTNQRSDVYREGWMLDNFTYHRTFVHTINEKEQEEYMIVFPSVTTGKVNIATKKINEFHIIEQIEVRNIEGKLVKQYGKSPTKFAIDIADQADGVYFIIVKTNKQTEKFKIVLTH